jgi:GWxTD domain-containing protein
MKVTTSRGVLLLVFCLFAILSIGAHEGLAPRHREWLDDVSPIITRTEREIFSRLQTDAERDKFIRFFWRQRDPLPDTIANEFQKEYLERLRFADENFGRGTSKRGRQTERGFYYLILGPPLERTLFTTQSQVWPLELWYYKGEVEYGLPPYFYLIFFQPLGSGEYRLYSPGVDGPEKLVVPSLSASSLNRSAAFQIIRRINAELAGAALNYQPGEQGLDTAGFSSNAVIAAVRSLPEKKFSDAYARNYLTYKDAVETEYLDRFIDSRFAAWVFEHEGQGFVHWTLEPGKIHFAARGGRYQAAFELVLRLEDPRGRLILEKTEEIPLSVTPEQYKAHEKSAFAFQDVLPVIPGRFKLLGLLKNETARDFTSFNASLTVPEKNGEFRPGGLILYHSREKAGIDSGQGMQAFSFGGEHYLVNARNEFPPGAELGLYLQIPRLNSQTLGPRTSLRLEIRPADVESAVLSESRSLVGSLSASGDGVNFDRVSLAGLKPGYFSAELSLVAGNGRKIAEVRENFILLSEPFPVVPWVYARTRSPFPGAEHLSLLASEYYQAQRYDRALDLATQSLELKDDPANGLLRAQSLFALGRYQDSLTAAVPVYDATKSRDVAKVIAACYAAQRKWAESLVYLERLMADATEISVLNLAGECYVNLGQPELALPLLEKSLQLKPDQPAVRGLAEEARKKKKEK